jgi:MoaA/NifB/PqqE/SkfB family radical SAM enzyme
MNTDFLSAPLMTTVDITNRCNLNCSYCYAHNENDTDMSKEMVLNIIRELHDIGVWEIVIGGGEPFLHPDILLILKILLSEGKEIGLITNATIINKDQLDEIAWLSSIYSKSFHIQISIDSVIPEVNDILRGLGKKVLYTIDKLIGLNIKFSTGTVIHKNNADCIEELITYLYPGVKKFHFTELMPSHSIRNGTCNLYPSSEQLENSIVIFEKCKKKYRDIEIIYPDLNRIIEEKHRPTLSCQGCTGAVTRMDITAKGEVLACNIADKAKLGNFSKGTITGLWRSERAKKYRNSPYPLCQI